jgi:hypothetical protein
MIRLIGLLSLSLLLASPALADCKSVPVAKQYAVDHDGQWIELDSDQWEFVRGLSILHPHTMNGMPPGNRAALIKLVEGGMILFIDGNQACAPMGLTPEIVQIIIDVGEGKVWHEGGT